MSWPEGLQGDSTGSKTRNHKDRCSDAIDDAIYNLMYVYDKSYLIMYVHHPSVLVQLTVHRIPYRTHTPHGCSEREYWKREKSQPPRYYHDVCPCVCLRVCLRVFSQNGDRREYESIT